MRKIKNILFDLGGVILNLDMNRTEIAFAKLCENQEVYLAIRQKLFEAAVFSDLETGQITEKQFIKAFQAANSLPVSEKQVRNAWSAMLLDMPLERIELLKELRNTGYRLYLLSNINSIHLADIYSYLAVTYPNLDFDSLFDKPYYSHLIGERKPNASAFKMVLADANIQAKETLFIDDNADNVATASQLGFLTIHHDANTDLRASLQAKIDS